MVERERLIRLMLEYNQAARSGIRDEELIAALLAHDIAMAYTSKHTEQRRQAQPNLEQSRMRHHIDVGYGFT